ncbi:MFS transporter [Galbibacter sp. PAP.153]|uniref:MFS transporter n=1 Tax=Galbibacter sp. PAP.153 TaxID=3104623 RepID=UPI003009A7DB
MQPKQLFKIASVLLCYFVMGFVDIVGVSTGYAQRDFDLSPELSQLIPSMVFVWFFVLSIPVGVLQNNYGKRKLLLIGIFITAIGMFLPFILYTYGSLLACFVLLGVGNTIIQVSVNPLLQEVVSKSNFSSFMSLSQFIKAISSLLGPVLVTFMVGWMSDWKYVLIFYGVTAVLCGLWLALTPVQETRCEERASFKTALALLKNRFIACMVLAIFLIVGLDVGMNTNIQNLLVRKFDVSLENASLGISVYFLALMISRFAGALILARVDTVKFLWWSAVLTVGSLILTILAPSPLSASVFIFMTGLSSGNLFPLIFSITIGKYPERSSEISGLMIMAVVGGAVIPPLMGVVNNYFGVSWSFGVLLIGALYVLGAYFIIKSN